MKKLLLVLIMLSMLVGCGQKEAESDKLQIVTTLFPQYDFTRQIAGDRADVTLLMAPGIEAHSFDPSPADIIKIKESDLFIYTSKYMEPWAEKLIESGGADGSSVWQAASGINHEKHGGDIDAHVWTNPENAMIMAENILRALCTIDTENAHYYTKNYNSYIEKLSELDRSFEEITKEAPVKKMVFGTKFALHYFAERYSLSHMSAFDSCGHEGEPAGKVMKDIIETVKNEKIPAVFYGEMESAKVAETIAEETGVKTLLFHSCHNVTKEEFENGETYVSLMEKNLKALKEGLYND